MASTTSGKADSVDQFCQRLWSVTVHRHGLDSLAGQISFVIILTIALALALVTIAVAVTEGCHGGGVKGDVCTQGQGEPGLLAAGVQSAQR